MIVNSLCFSSKAYLLHMLLQEVIALCRCVELIILVIFSFFMVLPSRKIVGCVFEALKVIEPIGLKQILFY